MHPLTLETLASSHQADLLAEAANDRLARSAHATRQSGHSPARLLRVRHGLATTLAAAALVIALSLS